MPNNMVLTIAINPKDYGAKSFAEIIFPRKRISCVNKRVPKEIAPALISFFLKFDDCTYVSINVVFCFDIASCKADSKRIVDFAQEPLVAVAYAESDIRPQSAADNSSMAAAPSRSAVALLKSTKWPLMPF